MAGHAELVGGKKAWLANTAVVDGVVICIGLTLDAGALHVVEVGVAVAVCSIEGRKGRAYLAGVVVV